MTITGRGLAASHLRRVIMHAIVVYSFTVWLYRHALYIVTLCSTIRTVEDQPVLEIKPLVQTTKML